LGVSYGCIVPHSPNLVPEVGQNLARLASRTRESMEELGMLIGSRRVRSCVVVSPHSPFLPEAFGVWEAGQLKGTMARFQAPDVTVRVDVDLELAEAIVDTASRMELPVGRIERDWELDRGVTVPSLYLLKTDEVKVVPVAISMLGWDEHWLFGSAVAKAAGQVHGDVAIVASANLSHRVTEDAPHGYDPCGAKYDGLIRDAIARGQLKEFLDIPQHLVSEASECGMSPLLVLGGAFDGETVDGRILSYETPFGIGYLVAEITRTDKISEPLRAWTGAEVSART
jgi:AmmeMemoRadiSam system protein B